MDAGLSGYVSKLRDRTAAAFLRFCIRRRSRRLWMAHLRSAQSASRYREQNGQQEATPPRQHQSFRFAVADQLEVFLGRDVYGAPGVIRTPDLLVRSQLLYPAELRAHIARDATC